MSGHSKWSTIKHKKAAQDAKRSKIFTRLLKEITVASRMGGSDPQANPRLRNAIQDAKSNNVPGDNIERAVKKGSGELEGMALEEVAYEGYGPGGVAVLVETVTDNRNRTVGEIRHLFSKYGGNLGENGCVSWMFNRQGYFVLGDSPMDEEDFMEMAVELGAEDFTVDEDGMQLYMPADSFHSTREALAERGVEPELSQLAMVPQNQIKVESDKAPQLLRLLDALEEQDDVQNVWANFELDEELLAELA